MNNHCVLLTACCVLSKSRLVRSAQYVVRSALLLPALWACGPSQEPSDLRLWSDKRAFRISVEPMPPHALEPARFRIVVRDRTTGQPLQRGEGRIFATSADGANTDDGLAKGDEVGTFYGRLFFVTAGDWAVAIQFRADSTERLERVDWVQSVLGERPPGSEDE
jgi:hypothetical protein